MLTCLLEQAYVKDRPTFVKNVRTFERAVLQATCDLQPAHRLRSPSRRYVPQWYLLATCQVLKLTPPSRSTRCRPERYWTFDLHLFCTTFITSLQPRVPPFRAPFTACGIGLMLSEADIGSSCCCISRSTIKSSS